jgi:hypothetical protein
MVDEQACVYGEYAFALVATWPAANTGAVFEKLEGAAA